MQNWKKGSHSSVGGTSWESGPYLTHSAFGTREQNLTYTELAVPLMLLVLCPLAVEKCSAPGSLMEMVGWMAELWGYRKPSVNAHTCTQVDLSPASVGFLRTPVTKHLTKSSLGGGVYFILHFPVTVHHGRKDVGAGTQRENLEAGTEAEAREEHFLLACFLRLAQLSYGTQAHQLWGGTAHRCALPQQSPTKTCLQAYPVEAFCQLRFALR